MATRELDVVREWHAATNAGAVERVLALTTEDVAVAGPRGVASGHGVLRDWVAGAGIELTAGRVFARGGTVVVEQRASWRDAAGEVGEEHVVASVFELRDGRIGRIARHETLEAALADGGLTRADAVPGP